MKCTDAARAGRAADAIRLFAERGGKILFKSQTAYFDK